MRSYRLDGSPCPPSAAPPTAAPAAPTSASGEGTDTAADAGSCWEKTSDVLTNQVVKAAAEETLWEEMLEAAERQEKLPDDYREISDALNERRAARAKAVHALHKTAGSAGQ